MPRVSYAALGTSTNPNGFRALLPARMDASYPCSVATGPHRRLIVDYEIESPITPRRDAVVEYEPTRAQADHRAFRRYSSALG